MFIPIGFVIEPRHVLRTLPSKVSQFEETNILFYQVFQSLDKTEFLNMLSGDRKSTAKKARKSEVAKIEPKVKDEESETW
jgi:hypothetical protein